MSGERVCGERDLVTTEAALAGKPSLSKMAENGLAVQDGAGEIAALSSVLGAVDRRRPKTVTATHRGRAQKRSLSMVQISRLVPFHPSRLGVHQVKVVKK